MFWSNLLAMTYPLNNPTLRYYEEHAGHLSAQYIAADVSSLHSLLDKWLPDKGRVLEIGCGSGRDAYWMGRRGLDVVATDASESMLAEAARQHPVSSVLFMPAIFPLAEDSELLRDRFDAIVCIAVCMHLPDNELFDSVFQMREMLKPGGRVICSFCRNRSPDASDARLFVNREPQEVQLLFERIGFVFRARVDSADGLGRDILWSTLVFDHDSTVGGRPVDQIETIINHDKKTATYKLALLRALCELAQSGYRNVDWHSDGTVSLPLSLIAEKWLYFYWPLFDTPDGKPILQIRGSNKLLFEEELQALISLYASQNQLSGFHCALEAGCLNTTAQTLVRGALKKISQAIVKGPIRYATQGGFRFDRLSDRVYFNSGLWREMCLLGHWISDAILFRWAELCADFSGQKGDTVKVLGQLIIRPETERDVVDARKIYQSQENLTCVWTQVPLRGKRFDVDHVIPFSLWHNNDLWNLLPTDSIVNNNKRDKLVSRDALFSSREAVVDCWKTAHSAMPERFHFEISRTLFGRNHPDTQWEKPAFSALVEAVETLAIQRNIERWKPNYQPTSTTISANHVAPANNISNFFGQSETRYIQDVEEIRRRAFKTILPIVGRMAAGPFFDGLETGNLERVDELDWVEVTESLGGRNRFVVRVAGDSMEPLFHVDDLLVFEYHRTPRQDGQIVIAANFSIGEEYAVKRFKADPTSWRFLSENSSYAPINIPKDEMPEYPILGTFVGRV